MEHKIIVDWCENKKVSLRRQLELFETGTLRSGENVGSSWIDTTEKSIERLKGDIAELDRLITQYRDKNEAPRSVAHRFSG